MRVQKLKIKLGKYALFRKKIIKSGKFLILGDFLLADQDFCFFNKGRGQ